jgi:hypothetical protein
LLDRRYVQRGDIVSRSLGEETILVPLKRGIVELGCLFSLNETGAFLWQQLARPRSVAQLAAALTEEFEVGEEQALEDTRTLVQQLLDEGCIETGDS